MLCLSVGPVGIEPTSSGLRDRCITLSATVPNQSARRELNPRPASYKDAALTVELRASESRVGGDRTHTVQIKSLLCCLLHHDPIIGRAYAFQSACVHRSAPWLFVVSGSPEDRTQRNPAYQTDSGNQPSTTVSKSGTSESNPGTDRRLVASCSQSRRARAPTRSVGRCSCTRTISDPDHLTAVPGSRTQPPRLERPMTSPEVERAALSTFTER